MDQNSTTSLSEHDRPSGTQTTGVRGGSPAPTGATLVEDRPSHPRDLGTSGHPTGGRRGSVMKALVYEGPGQRSWREVPLPEIQRPTDIIVKMVATTICGTDLHILKGDLPEVAPGRILGHEGIGVITEVGAAVTTLAVGDRVLLSCISSCGVCLNCRQALPSHCLDPEGTAGIGWILGYLIDGTQAEYVRIPFAAGSVHRIPEGLSDAEVILLSDILPTGFEIGVRYGGVKPGDVVAVIGAGPVGLAAAATARLYGPSRVVVVDVDASRLAMALEVGATHAVDSGDADWQEQVLALTDGHGVDVAIEAVGVPDTFTMATRLVRPGGHVANVGVHGRPVQLALNELWIRNITVTMGLVNADTTGLLLKLVADRLLPTSKFVTHTFGFDQILEAYDVFEHAGRHQALKVLIH